MCTNMYVYICVLFSKHMYCIFLVLPHTYVYQPLVIVNTHSQVFGRLFYVNGDSHINNIHFHT